jgi:hypothetical protein
MKSDKISPVLLVVLGVLLGLLAFLVLVVNPFGWELKIPSLFKLPSKNTPVEITPTPTPYPLPHGKQTYTISGNMPGAPKISEVTFDPLDPAKSSDVNLVVKTSDTSGVAGVEVTLNTDNKDSVVKLYLREGSVNNGVWKGSVKVDDSYNYIYRFLIKAKNTKGILQSNTITIR